MNHSGTQISARFVADLLAKIFGPSFYDGPRYGVGPLDQLVLGASQQVSDRRSAVMLNPQPLPPRAMLAMNLADAHIQEVLSLDRVGSLMGEEVAERAVNRALRLVEDVDEICPRWPRWPKVWPPPPPPWWDLGDEMTSPELFLFGTRFIAAAGQVSEEKLQDALARLGEKALNLSAQEP
jgi:hypothetical protein